MEKKQREENLKMQRDAKDGEFLKKLQDSLDVKKNSEARKKKDREMQHAMMMRKLDKQREDRLMNVAGVSKKRKDTIAPVNHNSAAHRILKNN